MGAEMSITALVAGAAIVIAAAGFGAGWGLRPVPDTADAIEEVAATIEAQGEAIASVAEAAGRPVVIDAELRSTLAEVPVQCRTGAGGDPMSPACQWATCLQYGQSSANRPECSTVSAAMIEALAGCPEPPPPGR
jgi:hypothetical protein